jgi:hypothetical protein
MSIKPFTNTCSRCQCIDSNSSLRYNNYASGLDDQSRWDRDLAKTSRGDGPKGCACLTGTLEHGVQRPGPGRVQSGLRNTGELNGVVAPM